MRAVDGNQLGTRFVPGWSAITAVDQQNYRMTGPAAETSTTTTTTAAMTPFDPVPDSDFTAVIAKFTVYYLSHFHQHHI